MFRALAANLQERAPSCHSCQASVFVVARFSSCPEARWPTRRTWAASARRGPWAPGRVCALCARREFAARRAADCRNRD
eukprot:12333750-Alexandrium_andersonii.AAC.1